jgi:hypothetical protein
MSQARRQSLKAVGRGGFIYRARGFFAKQAVFRERRDEGAPTRPSGPYGEEVQRVPARAQGLQCGEESA